MIYGNGISSDFVGSGYGVYVNEWSGTYVTERLPIITSKSGINYPTNVEDALFAARATVFSAGKPRGHQMGGIFKELSGEYSYQSQLGIGAFTGTFCGSNGGYDNKPFQYLYKCLNWWDFASETTKPTDHLKNIDSQYGGFCNIGISAWKGLDYKILVPNSGVSCTLPDDTCHGYFHIASNTRGMPGYMGGSVLFSTDESFNENKFIGIGFKGMSQSINNENDYAFKLYRFTDKDGYIKSIGNKNFIFNDPHIVGVKGHGSGTPTGMPNNLDNHDYSGPFYVRTAISAGYYTDNSQNKKVTLNIKDTDFAKIDIKNSLSYLMVDHDPDMTYIKPANISMPYYFGNYSAGCRIKTWTDQVNNTLYVTQYPFAPGIPLATGDYHGYDFYLCEDIEEVSFGSCLSSFCYIWKYNSSSPLKKLKAIRGSWKYCTNLYGGTLTGLFMDASALSAIPSSWSGLSTITTMYQAFKNCTALTGIPSSWAGLDTLSYPASMFSNCTSLVNMPSSCEGLSNVTYLGNMFENCISLKNCPYSFRGVGNVSYAADMFNNCKVLENAPSSWEGLENCNSVDSMFRKCEKITKIPTKWTGLATNYANTIDGDLMFEGCTSLSAVDSWTDFKIGTFAGGFMNCKSLKNIPSTWAGFGICSNPVSAFANCTSLTDIPTSWEGKGSSPNYESLFEGCTSLTGIPTTQEAWAAFGSGNIYRMFANCTSLTMDPKPIMDGLNRRVSSGYSAHIGQQMFAGCVNLQNYSEYASPTSVYSSYFI